MRQMAARLGIDVGEHRWPRLVQAATFESMRSKADTTVPGGGPEHWIDPAAFFSRGTSGQWRDLLDDADLARYAACAGARLRQPHRVGASQADRLRSPSGGIPALPKADRQRRPPPITADPRSGPTSGVCASTDAAFGDRIVRVSAPSSQSVISPGIRNRAHSCPYGRYGRQTGRRASVVCLARTGRYARIQWRTRPGL